MDEEPKAKSKSVSLLPELWERVEAKAAASYGGNRSAYLRELAERDLSGSLSTAPSASVILELARIYAPTLAADLDIQLAGDGGERALNQARIIARFLDALHESLAGNFNPELKFELADKAKIAEWTAISDERIAKAAIAMATELNTAGGQRLIGMHSLNDPAPAPYSKKKSAGTRVPGSTPPIPQTG